MVPGDSKPGGPGPPYDESRFPRRELPFYYDRNNIGLMAWT
jgi:hypothetical protein